MTKKSKRIVYSITGDQMKYLKKILFLLFIIGLGIFSGIYIYRQYEKENSLEVFNEEYTIYLLQYGVYKNKDSMLEAGNNITDYLYFEDKDGYHLIIGVTENKENTDKIRESFNITENIYTKEVKIKNNEFMESLRQYDNLVKNSNSNQEVVAAEKYVLSKYEELILNNE